MAAPETMKGAVVSKAGAKLVKLGFAREILEKPGTPLWRRDEAGRSFALKLTAAGLKAIVVDGGPQEAIEPGEASQPQLLPEAKNGVSLNDVGRHPPTAAPRDGSKLALMIDLLRRADGATIVDLTQATEWLAAHDAGSDYRAAQAGICGDPRTHRRRGICLPDPQAPLPAAEIAWSRRVDGRPS